jgi:DNA polymerase-3 subunit alpha (Gram-positive type)
MKKQRKRKYSHFVLPVIVLVLTTAASRPPASAKQGFKQDASISEVTFVAFDTETTGFGSAKNRIVEIGAVKFRSGKVVAEKSWLINPERDIPYWAENVHGISAEMIKDSPTFAEMYPEFLEFIGNTVLLAHNAHFDVDFMASSIRRAGEPLPENPVLDSLRLFSTWYPDAPSHSLEPLSAYLELEGDTYHRATDDSRYIFLIMDKWLDGKWNTYTYGELLEDATKVLHF